jgi:hypothetical protein
MRDWSSSAEGIVAITNMSRRFGSKTVLNAWPAKGPAAGAAATGSKL